MANGFPLKIVICSEVKLDKILPHSDLWEKPVGWAEEWLYNLTFPSQPTGWIVKPFRKRGNQPDTHPTSTRLQPDPNHIPTQPKSNLNPNPSPVQHNPNPF